MFFNPAPSVKAFCDELAGRVGLSAPLQALLIMFVMGVVVTGGKRSLAALGSSMAMLSRYRGQVSRATRNRAFRTRDLYKSAFARAVKQLGVSGKSRER